VRTILQLIVLSSAFVLLGGCQSNQKWEYKILTAPSERYSRTGTDAFKPTTASPSESDLNKLGSEGWELVASYLEMETAHPNFGSESYVTGLQPNIRPQRAVLIFKRISKQ
jgi:hypothetical protein